jgi:hypothetical protein
MKEGKGKFNTRRKYIELQQGNTKHQTFFFFASNTILKALPTPINEAINEEHYKSLIKGKAKF